LADFVAQPSPVFSRDLKYMLEARHAAAPLRRPAPRAALVAALVVALTAGGWAGMRLLAPAPAGTDTSTGLPIRQSSVAPGLPLHQAEYTQLERAVSKEGNSKEGQSVHPRDHSLAPTDDEHRQQPVATREIEWRSYSVRRGDTLGKIFSRFSIDIGLANRIAAHETGRALVKLMPDRTMYFGFDDNERLIKLRYEISRLEELVVDFRDSGDFTVGTMAVPVDTRERRASGKIGSSLFVAASKAGVSDRLAMELLSIFGWEIDFALDIRSGDRFSIIYEEMFKDGESIGTGDIIAAEFVNRGTAFHAIRHIDDNGRKQYFDAEGNSLRGTFLRTPMRISRVTSGFTKRRFHPVLKEWRAHRGVDYGAPTGTPVLATGDGRVHSAGRNGGYGNTVILKHGGRYSTLYAHLSRYGEGIRRGATVTQGDVIGYVGSTGLATGPHLHYEFRVNGKHRDPLSFETPKAAPIEDRYRDEFLAIAKNRLEQIADIRPEQIASR